MQTETLKASEVFSPTRTQARRVARRTIRTHPFRAHLDENGLIQVKYGTVVRTLFRTDLGAKLKPDTRDLAHQVTEVVTRHTGMGLQQPVFPGHSGNNFTYDCGNLRVVVCRVPLASKIQPVVTAQGLGDTQGSLKLLSQFLPGLFLIAANCAADFNNGRRYIFSVTGPDSADGDD